MKRTWSSCWVVLFYRASISSNLSSTMVFSWSELVPLLVSEEVYKGSAMDYFTTAHKWSTKDDCNSWQISSVLGYCKTGLLLHWTRTSMLVCQVCIHFRVQSGIIADVKRFWRVGTHGKVYTTRWAEESVMEDYERWNSLKRKPGTSYDAPLPNSVLEPKKLTLFWKNCAG